MMKPRQRREAVRAVLAMESPFVLNEVNLDKPFTDALTNGSYFQAAPTSRRTGEAFV